MTSCWFFSNYIIAIDNSKIKKKMTHTTLELATTRPFRPETSPSVLFYIFFSGYNSQPIFTDGVCLHVLCCCCSMFMHILQYFSFFYLGGVVLQQLLGWLRMHFTEVDDDARSALAESIPDQHPRYWHAVSVATIRMTKTLEQSLIVTYMLTHFIIS